MNGNVIRTITIKGTSEGLDKLQGDLSKLAGAHKDVVIATESTEKANRSLEQSWQTQTLRLDAVARAQNKAASETKLAQRALEQGLVTQQQYAERLDLINQKYNQGTAAQKAFATATSGVSAQLVAMAAGAGPVGVFLSALGPWGMAASVGLGAAAAVFDRLVEGANRMGDKSIELRKFSDITGLSVTQVKGLTKAGAELGVASEAVETAIERFSVGLNEAHKGSGDLLKKVMEINPQLAIELAQSKGTAQGWDILARAIKGATDEAQRNALSRAAFGRGGLETGLVAMKSADTGGVEAMGEKIAKATGLTKEWVAETARLRAENIMMEKSLQTMMDSLYARDVLERQNQFLKAQIEIAKWLKEASSSVPNANAPGRSSFDLIHGGPQLPPEEIPERRPGANVQPRGHISEGAMAAQAEAAALREVLSVQKEITQEQKAQNAIREMGLSLTKDSLVLEQNKAIIFQQNAAQYSNVLATTAQQLAQLNSQLGVAQAIGGAAQIEAQHRATVTAELAKGRPMADAIAVADAQRAITLAKIEASHQTTMVALQGQLSVAQQTTGLGQINAQYEATINNLKQQGLSSSQATAQADMQRSISLAQVNAEADKTLKSLETEGELIRASSEAEKDRIKARKTYNDLIEKGVDKSKAEAVASQQLSNAEEERSKRERESEVSWREVSEAFVKAQNASERMANNLALSATEMQSIKNDAEGAAKFFTKLPLTYSNPLMNPYIVGKDAWDIGGGNLVQFNPAGYQSTIGPSPAQLAMEEQKKKIAAYQTALQAQSTTPNLTTYTPETEGIRKQIEALQLRNQSLPTAGNAREIERLTALANAIEEQTRATKENTSATQAMTDVLSPFYSTDPRNMRLGFRAFAGGGIMTPYGELPLKHYASSGIATSPQVAVFGEGSTPEAYVPAPSGKIPVKLDMPANSNKPVVVNINIRGDADAGTVAALKSTSFQQAQAMRRVMR